MIITGAKSDHWQAQDRVTSSYCCIGKDYVNGRKGEIFSSLFSRVVDAFITRELLVFLNVNYEHVMIV
jgi:hypothetical protein